MGATRPASTFGGYGRFNLDIIGDERMPVIIGYERVPRGSIRLPLRALVDTGGAYRQVSDIPVESCATRFSFRCLRCVGDQAMNWDERLGSQPRFAIR